MGVRKEKQKEQAIQLRKQGLTYAEILEEVPVAKSTLSLWLHSVNLSKKQKQRITKKKLQAARRGAAKRKKQRIEKTKKIHREAEKDIRTLGELTERDLFLMGAALYWAEGSKERRGRVGASVEFINSDPRMIRIFLSWLLNTIKVEKSRIDFSIYIHESHRHAVNDVKKYWSQQTDFPLKDFSRVYYKKHEVKTKRKKVDNEEYFGILKIKVCESTDLHRRISGWINALSKYSAGWCNW